MRLKSFIANGLHGYLDFDLSFNERLTLLTGINGSGKTTILNCIHALLTPNLSTLQNTVYNKIQIVLEKENSKKLQITSIQEESKIEISATDSERAFVYDRYVHDQSLPSHRQVEAEAEHFRDLIAISTNHPVMKTISSFSNPMYLGIDRRAKLAAEERRIGSAYRPWSIVPRRLNRGVLGTSVSEAEAIAVDAFRDAQISAGAVGDELQRQLIINLLKPFSSEITSLSMPTSSDKKEIERVRRDLDTFPAIFRLPPQEVQEAILPFLDTISSLSSRFPVDSDIKSYIDEHVDSENGLTDLVRWSNSKQQLKRIAVISKMVATYNDKRAKALEPIRNYTELVNRFLNDSGKSIEFDQRNRTVDVKIEGVKGEKSLAALSSGEAQIFIILTNLAFGAASREQNIFIIDEPELSLHVRWQEMFVDSVLAANQSTQFIMATHSPSIILERLKECVEVTVTRKGNRGS